MSVRLPSTMETLQLLALNISSVSESLMLGRTQNEKERPFKAALSRSATPALFVLSI